MRIDASNGFGAVNPTTTSATGVTGGSKAGVKPDAVAGAEDGTFTPTADLARLLDSIRKLPDVRNDVVADVTARLGTGELTTPAAAADTANAIISGN